MPCKICKSPILDQVNSMLRDGSKLQDVVQFAKDNGEYFSIDNASKHKRRCLPKFNLLNNPDGPPKTMNERVEYLVDYAFQNIDNVAGGMTVNNLVKLLEMQKEQGPKEFKFELSGDDKYKLLVRAINLLSESAKKELATLLKDLESEET